MVAKKIDKALKPQKEHVTKERQHYSQKFWAYIQTLELRDDLHKAVAFLTGEGCTLHIKEEIEQYITHHSETMEANYITPLHQPPNNTMNCCNAPPHSENLSGEISMAELKRHIRP